MSGEHYRDQFTYTRGVVAELLPMALDGPEPPARGLTDDGRGVGDPATAGNLLAMILDVRRVYDMLSLDDRGRIVCALIDGDPVPGYLLDELIELLGGPE